MALSFALLSSLLVAQGASAQSPITTLFLEADQIGLVKTGQGITTRISFPRPVSEIVCGDLYDPGSGKGSFVVQRSGNDVFLKPVVSKAYSNLFVKTGESGAHVYNFDLTVVSASEAHRVVNVTGPAAQPDAAIRGAEDPGSILTKAQQQVDEMIASAKQQASRIVAEADQRAADSDREAASRAASELERRIVRALMLGLREARISAQHVIARGVAISFDKRLLTFDDKSYIRFTMQNTGDADFVFKSISLEKVTADKREVLPVEVNLTKSETALKPTETVTVILSFDARLIGERERLTLYIRGEGDTELARSVMEMR
jgi:hypothetical protein